MTNENTSNQPKIEPWMDNYRREFRENAVQTIKEILEIENITFDNIQFFKDGSSNVVSLVEKQEGGHLVIKLMQPHQFTDEPHFYGFLKDRGLKTVPVHFSGLHNNIHYMIMDYMQLRTLNEINMDESLEKGLFRNLGRAIAQVNQIKIEGIGDLVNGKGKYQTAQEFLQKNYTSQEFFETIQSNTGIEFPSKAFQIFEDHIDNNGAYLTHGDLNLGNCFVSENEDIILFDPFPYSSFQFMDLGLLLTYLVRGTGGKYEQIREQFLEGYREVINISDEMVSAAIIINCYRKILTAIRKDNQPRLEAYIELYNREIRNL